MADEEAEQDSAHTHSSAAIGALRQKLQELAIALKNSTESPTQSSSRYCQDFCQTLVEYAARWRMEEDPLPLVEVYTVALLSYAQASPCLSSKCENVPLVLERLSLSCVELLLSLPEHFPDALWEEFKSSVQSAQSQLQENGITQLSLLSTVAQETGVWTNGTLHSLLSNESPQTEKVHKFLELEGPILLEMRVKHLIKENHMERAALLAKACAEYPEFEGKGHFKQMYLVCLCGVSAQEPLMEELSNVDCRDALEMICNLESEGDERGAFSLCSAFLTRQLLQGDTYCAWELTLFWSKLLKRLESSEETFLDRCRQMSLLSTTVFHILFLIKVIQSEMDKVGLPVCVDMCIRALQLESSNGNTKATICKTISCLLPTDLEVKRACQLTEFLLEPTVDSYYAVETLYNEPDQKLEEENLPVPNSLRCELLLVFKTQWPFDPEFWDWKTLKRHCLTLMGEEASIVSSIDLLNVNESPEAPEEEEDTAQGEEGFRDVTDCFIDTTHELNEIADKRQKNRETKKLREKGFISARFRNWQAYMQYCVLCDKEFLGHRIVRHAQTHYKDGLYSCPICAETFTSKDTLEPHVASHVKLSCKERLAAVKTNKKLANPKTAAPVIAALKAKTENQLWTKDANGESQEHNGQSLQTETVQTKVSGQKTESSTEENTCPIANCKKGFKYFRNLLVHVKAHGENDEAKRFLEMQSKKVICQYCRRQFVNVTHLNDHLQVHCGVRPYICIQLNCNASFLSNTELLVHKKEHVIFKARCMFPRCGKIFNEAYKLYDHEAQHYKTFTCKVPNCGKVFHSQSQLDLHQEEHVTNEEDYPATDSDLSHSLDQRMLSDQASFSEEVEAFHPTASVAVKHSIENLLNASQGPVQNDQRYMIKSEPQEKKLYPCSESSVIRSTTNAQMHDPNQLRHRPQQPSVAAAYDYMRPKSQTHNPLASYQDTGDLHHALQPNVLQGQDQGLLKGGSYGSRKYNSDYQEPVQAQHKQEQHPHMSVNMSAASQTSHYMSTPMPQTLTYASPTLLPLVTRLPDTGCRTDNSITQCPLPSTPAPQQSPLPSTPAPQQHPLPTALAPPQGQKERHHCSLETCDRSYSSYKSVTKHMKAVHPEFYTEWKLAKKKIREQEKAEKNRKAAPSSVPLIGNHNYVAPLQHQQANGAPVPVQRQNVIQSPMYPNSPHSYASHSAAVQSHAFPNQMDNILDPIVLSQLGNNPNQYAPPSMPWLQTPGNNQSQNCYASQVYPSNIQGMPQMDAVGGGMEVYVIPSRHMMGSNMERPAESLLPSPMDNGLQPVFPSYMDILKDSSLSNQMGNAAPSYTPQTQNNPGSKSRGLQKTNMESHFPHAGNLLAKSNSESQDGTINSGDAKNQMAKKVKRNKRTKWPAIVKDGKYICSRCGREFTNPKSLGGHLSKRAHCKAFDETELLTADLPSSFLDLLNSEQLLNTQPPPSALYNPTALLANDGEQPDEILKQIMDTPNIPNVFEPSAIPQPTFQNACGPYGPGGRLPESTVIQHTGNIQVKNENESYRGGYLPQSCDPGFGSSAFSDPLLFQMLAENNPTVSLHRLPTDHIDHLLRSETLMKMKEVKETSDSVSNDGLLAAMASLAQNLMTNPMLQITSPDSQPHHSPAATSSKLAETQRNSTEQNVKKRLREQILAGDIQIRSSLSQTSSTDTNASLSPVSSNPATNVVHHFGVHLSPQPSKTIDHGIPSVSSAQMNGAAPMQSFTNFREASSQHHEAPAPTSIVANDVDLGPNLTPINQPHWMVDIQTALERLDLDKQVCDFAPTYSSTKPSCTNICKDTESFGTNVSIEKDTQIPDGCMKPFACESDNCTYRAMTKVAILKHLTKTHNYTDEMINSIKKDHGKFAPFSCQMCDKTFTRNSNLRAHCQTAHRLTQQEIAQLKMKCQSSNTVGFVNNDDKPSVHSEPILTGQMVTAPYSITENIAHQYSLLDVNQNQDVTGNNLFALGERTKQEYYSQPLEQQTSRGLANSRFHDNSLSMGMQPMQRISMHDQTLTPSMPMSEYQMNAHCSTIPQLPLMTAPGTDHWSNGRHIPVPSRPSHYGQQPGGYLTERAASMTPAPSNPLQVCGPSLEKSPKIKQQRGPKPKVEIPKKTKEKKSEANNAFSPYRPYRCVHQGCAAAFTIQHNLILHYRAVHQSALSTCEINNENDQNDEQDEKKDIKQQGVMEEEPEGEVNQVTEFRCQVSGCSRLFQDVPNLLQHYLQLHKFSLDKAGSLMSNINLGRFCCDQQGCTASFTAFWKYIGHIEKEHDKAKLSKMEFVDGMFQCDVDGCDHAYATKSNLLRHTMKKHNDLYKLQLMNQRKSEDLGKPSLKNSHYQLTISSDGKENIESNKKITQKGGDKKKTTDKTEKNHWTKYGKPSLKTKDEASAMCIKKSTLQYPCMIKGCDSVMKSERSIMKHYMGHGLSERYLEEQRSHFIFCKKYPRRRNPRSARSDDSKSETTSDISDSEDTADTGLEGSEYDEYSKPALRRRGKGGLSDTKPSYDETSETVSDGSVVVKRKRGRPRKSNLEKIVKRKRVSRLTRSNAVYSGENGSDYDSSSTALTQDEMNDQSETLTSFKPMGFEMSFLKFLEQSNPPKNSLKKRIRLRNATVLCKRSDSYLHYPKGFDTLEFRNPQKLTSLNNVKIVVDKAFSDVADILLKQLQEMRPTVILEK